MFYCFRKLLGCSESVLSLRGSLDTDIGQSCDRDGTNRHPTLDSISRQCWSMYFMLMHVKNSHRNEERRGGWWCLSRMSAEDENIFCLFRLYHYLILINHFLPFLLYAELETLWRIPKHVDYSIVHKIGSFIALLKVMCLAWAGQNVLIK